MSTVKMVFLLAALALAAAVIVLPLLRDEPAAPRGLKADKAYLDAIAPPQDLGAETPRHAKAEPQRGPAAGRATSAMPAESASTAVLEPLPSPAPEPPPATDSRPAPASAPEPAQALASESAGPAATAPQVAELPEPAMPAAEAATVEGREAAVLPSGTEPTARPASAATVHRVGQGDSLYKLARRYYGDSSRWTLIRDANPDLGGGGVRELRLGSTLVIPAAPKKGR